MTNPPRPGYWLANDGKWYPPELHPDRIRERLAAERKERDVVIARPTAEAETSTVEQQPAATPPVETPPQSAAPDTASLASPMPHPSTPPLDSDLPVAEIDGPTDAELREIEQRNDGDLPVDAEVPDTLPKPDSRWSRPDVLEPAETVPLVPPAAETPDLPTPEIETPEVFVAELDTPGLDVEAIDASTLNAPDISAPEINAPEINAPEINAPEINAPEIDTPTLDSPEIDIPDVDVPDFDVPTVETPDIETLTAPTAEIPAAPPVFEPPAAEVTAPPIEPPPATTQTAASAEAPTRSPIPEPFPEASADDLVEAEPQKSFIRRWWLPLVLVLGALALVNWVIMPYIDTDRTSADDDQLEVFELAAGTCIDEAELELQTELKGTVERVPCSSAHTHEIFHTVNHPEGTFDRELIREFATAECVGMFETYTGEFYSRSELKFILLLPNEKAWDKDDRTTICALFGDGPLTESARS